MNVSDAEESVTSKSDSGRFVIQVDINVNYRVKESSSAVETRGKARQDNSQKNGPPSKQEDHQKGAPKRLKKGSGEDAPKRGKKSEEDLNEPLNGGDNEEEQEQKDEQKNEQKKGSRKEQHDQKKGDHKRSKKGKAEEENEEDEDMADQEDEDDSASVTAEDLAKFIQELKENVTVEELKSFLEENDLNSSGTDDHIYERSADALMFGPCSKCPTCGGVLEYAGQVYRCSGYVSEWSRCNYTTRDQDRARRPEKCKIPRNLENDFLGKWVETHDPVVRPLVPKEKFLTGMNFVLSGRMAHSHGEMKAAIEKHGGTVANAVRPGVTAVISPESEMSGGGTSKTLEAAEHGIPIVREDWLEDSIKKGKALPLQTYNMTPMIAGKDDERPWDQRPLEEASEALIMEVKLVGKRGVYKDTELQEQGGKIYEADDIIYNCAFSLCDITVKINQYAIMQLIEVDGTNTGNGKGQKIYLYFKEGRVGDPKSGLERLDLQRSPKVAVEEFVKLFEDVTGNPFEPWEREKVLEKKCGKYVPLDMANGVDVREGALAVHQLGVAATHCRLDSRVVDQFLKVLFSQTVYRFALTELGLEAPDLPTANLTDWHIDFCKKILEEFAEDLKKVEKDEKKKSLLCLDFSNKWFTMLHTTRPVLIENYFELAELGAATLESVRDICHASRLIGDMSSDGTLDDPISDRYKAMGCEMTPLDRGGDDYKMIEKYFTTTMEPLKESDGEYNCMIEDIVRLNSKAAPSMEEMRKMPNKVLLWCGMRTSNYVACLSRGMLPALIEAPGIPGYCFGRGLYCSDAACKAAKYGFTAVERAEGFLVVAIVSLGKEVLELPAPEKDVKEYEKAGKAIKGLGKRTPDEEEFFKWDKNVTVPCGKLKDSKVKGAFLDYNEYVVYNPKQVMPAFLVRTRFEGVLTMEE